MFLKDWHQFFERLTGMLDNYYSPLFDTANHRKLDDRTELYLKQLERMKEALRLMRDAALKEAANQDVRGR